VPNGSTCFHSGLFVLRPDPSRAARLDELAAQALAGGGRSTFARCPARNEQAVLNAAFPSFARLALPLVAPRAPADELCLRPERGTGAYHAWGGSSPLQNEESLRRCPVEDVLGGAPCVPPQRARSGRPLPDRYQWAAECVPMHTRYGRAFWGAFRALPEATQAFCLREPKLLAGSQAELVGEGEGADGSVGTAPPEAL